RTQRIEVDREALTAAEAEAAQLRTELAAQREQVDRLHEAQTEAERRRAAAEEKLARQQAALEAARLALEQERAAWEAKQSEPVAAPTDSAAQLAEEELARLQQELDAQHSVVAEAQRQQAAAEADLARHQSELAAARRELDEERTRWQAEQTERSQSAEADQATAAQQAAADHQRLAALEAELESLRRAWDEERQAWQAEAQHRATAPLAAPVDASGLQDQLLELTAELENARRALDDDRRHWEAERLRQQAELAGHAEQLRALRRDAATGEPASALPDATSQVSAESPDAHVEAADLLHQFAGHEAEEISFAEPAEAAPVNMTDLLSRFGISLDTTPDEHAKSDDDAAVASPTSEIATRPAKPAEEDEDSIDAYMARLMQRLGAKTPSPPSRPHHEAQPSPRAAPAVVDQPEPEESPAAPVVAKLSDPSEMGRRALPPERAADLSAMRELANLNARSAIDKHERRTMRDTGLNKAAVTLVGMVTALVEGALWLHGSPTAFYLMLGGGVVALFWGWQYYAALQKFAATAEAAPQTVERRVADRRAAEPPIATTEIVAAADSAAPDEPADLS
ncbi:MAG TPA: hypothetical protein VFW87_00785, partial [Pirellulales bacterium]|nr:hypothetical protein [Pirellulales bacterium]